MNRDEIKEAYKKWRGQRKIRRSVIQDHEPWFACAEWMMSQASEEFDEWKESCIKKVVGMTEQKARNCLTELMTPEKLWQAAKLSSMKEIAEKDKRIAELKEFVQRFLTLGTCVTLEDHKQLLRNAAELVSKKEDL